MTTVIKLCNYLLIEHPDEVSHKTVIEKVNALEDPIADFDFVDFHLTIREYTKLFGFPIKLTLLSPEMMNRRINQQP
jgi:hypothetical protein